MNTSKHIRKLPVVLFLSVLTATVVMAQNRTYPTVNKNGQTFYTYKVQTGEGVYAIARTFSVSADDILKNNPDAKNGLKSGQELLIPVAGNGRAAENPLVGQNYAFKHTVMRGETLYGISQMYDTSVNEILRSNPGMTENIAVGQEITIPQQRAAYTGKSNYRYHNILPKETLYSVSRTYSLKPEDLIASNPGLSVETFQAGKTIRIPFSESNVDFVPFLQQTQNIAHKVKRGETLYSISQKYDVPVENIRKTNTIPDKGLKTGMELIIPVKVTELEDNLEAKIIDANRLLMQSEDTKRADVIDVGLLLPFLDKSQEQHLRLQEYYEGFLLAVNKMKSEGADINVYTFDIGSQAKLKSLLGTLEMQSLDLLIGGITDEQISVLSEFSKKYNIKYVIPFSSKNKEVQNNSNIFQVNTPYSYIYSKASSIFTNEFKNKNVIIVNVPDKKDKNDFIRILKTDLRENKVPYKEITLNADLTAGLQPLLTSNNVITLSSGDSRALREVMAAVAKARQTMSDHPVTNFFGFPEWQTFDAATTREMHKYGTYFYTSFFYDEKDAETERFNEEFKNWYGRSLINTTPKYGIMGYDTGLYFLSAIHRFGTNFEQRISRVPSNYVQYAFNFERVNNWGGFINTGLYLIYYDTDESVVKKNKSR